MKKYLYAAASLIIAASMLIVPVVYADRGETASEPEVSEEQSSAGEEEADPDSDCIIAGSPGGSSKPVIPAVKETVVDVGLCYGKSAPREITLSAPEGSMLYFDGSVYRTLSFTLRDGKLVCGGREYYGATVRSTGTTVLSATGYEYDGKFILSCGEQGITVVNRVTLEEYVKGVMSPEIGTKCSYESRKAFAIIARTLVFSKTGHRGFDVCATSDCQVYNGRHDADAENDRAVDETAGLILTYMDKPCLACYGSSQGQWSCSSAAAWVGSDIPYLRCVYYENEPYTTYGGEWDAARSWTQLSERLGKYTVTGTVTDIAVAERDPHGGSYAYVLRITDSGDNVYDLYYASSIASSLGVRSGNFTIEYTDTGVILHGKGNGHGVGYSQVGGNAMGCDGYSFDEILAFYYPGTEIDTAPAK